MKHKEDIEHIYKSKIKGYVKFMENRLSKDFKRRYYFGIPAAMKLKKEDDMLNIARTTLIKSYNNSLKKEVLSYSSYFIDVENGLESAYLMKSMVRFTGAFSASLTLDDEDHFFE